jgi:autotransporter-associated beta strand protein
VVNFNGATTLRALDNNMSFITGFSGTELAIGSGVLTIDSGAFTVGTDTSSFSGPGALTKTGSGTLTLSGPNSYTGATTVADGTLEAAAVNTLPGLSAVTVKSPGILDLHGFSQSIGSLAGDGSVTLGNAKLTTGNDNTNTTFSGVISGTGGSIKSGREPSL